MAVKDMTVAETLKQLYSLQLIDSSIDEIQILKGELPMEVSDLEDEVAGLETRIRRLEEGTKDLKDTISAHHANIKEAEALALKYEKQMDNVKNNREYDALSKELELQKLEVQLSNKKIKETEGLLEIKEGTLTDSLGNLDTKKAELETKRDELEKIIEKTEKEEVKLEKKSKSQKKKIEDRLIKSYDRIRSRYKNGLAVVTVARNSCGGCFNKIPPQVQLEIARRTKIIACEHCGRVLVDDAIMEKEPAAEKA